MNKLKSFNSEELLGLLGLETKQPTTDYLVPAITIFAVGFLVGAGTGLLFAPRPGRELREDLVGRIQSVPDALSRLPARAAELTHRMGDAVNRAADQVRESIEPARA